MQKKYKLPALVTALVAGPILVLTPALAYFNATPNDAKDAHSAVKSSQAVVVVDSDLSHCVPGHPTDASRNALVKAINAARHVNDLAAVSDVASLNNYAQRATLYFARNNVLAHTLDPKNPCYSEQGDSAASHSVVVAGAPTYSVADLAAALLTDDMKNSKLGHRLQLLAPQLAATGVGMSRGEGGKNYISVLTDNGFKLKPAVADEAKISNVNAPKPELIAWPNAGFFAYSLMPISHVDNQNTWSASLKGDFTGDVKVTVTGPDSKPVKVGKAEIVSKASQGDMPGYTSVAFEMPTNLAQPKTYDPYHVTVSVGKQVVAYDVKLMADNYQPVIPKIIKNLNNTTVKPNEATKFDIIATGEQLKYVWQESADGGDSWSQIVDSNGKPLTGPEQTLTLAPQASGTLIRVLVTDMGGGEAYTKVAQIKVEGANTSLPALKSNYDEYGKVKPAETKSTEPSSSVRPTAKPTPSVKPTPRVKPTPTAKTATSRSVPPVGTSSVATSVAPSASATPVPSMPTSPTPTVTQPAQEVSEITLSQSKVVAGQFVVVRVGGFKPGELVQGEFHSKVIDLGMVRSDDQGYIDWRVSTRGLPVGEHHIVLKGLTSGVVISAPLTITAAAGVAGWGLSIPILLAGIAVIVVAIVIIVGAVVARRDGEF